MAASKEIKGVEQEDKMTPRHYVMAVQFCISYMCAIMNFSLLAPFFPGEAAKKGLSPTATGLVLGVFQLMCFVLSPVWGYYLPKIGSRFMFIAGIAMCGTCGVLFGFLDNCPGGNIYLIMCLTCRLFEGAGDSMYCCAVYAIVGKDFPARRVSLMIGLLQTFYATGMLLGPVVGGALFELGGFKLPFFVMGGCTLLSGMVGLFVLPRIVDHLKEPTDDNGVKRSMLHFFLTPRVSMVCLSTTMGAVTMTYIEPILQPFLTTLGNRSALRVGVMFLIFTASGALLCPILGWLLGHRPTWTKTFMLLGNLLSILASLVMGPAPFFPGAKPNYATLTVGLVLQGVAVISTIVPAYQDHFNTALELGYPDDSQTAGYASAFYLACQYLGSFLGPVIAGALAETLSFPWIAVTMTIVPALCALIMSGYLAGRFCAEKRRELSANDTDCSEKTPMLLNEEGNNFFKLFSVSKKQTE